MPRTLIDIGGDLEALGALLTETEGEIPEGTAGEAIEKWFSELGHERDQKLDNYAGLVGHLKGEAELLKAEAARLTARAQSREQAIAQLKERLKYFFEVHGLKRIKALRHTLTLAGNGGKAPIEWTGEVPDDYNRIIFEPNKEAIREALEEGEELDFARLGERGKHMKIS